MQNWVSSLVLMVVSEVSETGAPIARATWSPMLLCIVDATNKGPIEPGCLVAYRLMESNTTVSVSCVDGSTARQ